MLGFKVDCARLSAEGTEWGVGAGRTLGEEEGGGRECPVSPLKHFSVSGDSFYSKRAPGH